MMIQGLKDIKGERGIEVAARLLHLVAELLTDERNADLKDEPNPIKMFCAFAQNTPDIMRRIFAVIGGEDEDAYTCDASESMINLMTLANDPVFVGFFVSRGRTGDATSSASVSENIEG